MTGPDEVLVSKMTLVSGLERKVSSGQQFPQVPCTDNHDNEFQFQFQFQFQLKMAS